MPGIGAEDEAGQGLCTAGRNSLLLRKKMDQKAGADYGLRSERISGRM